MSQFSQWLPSRRQLQQNLARLVDTLEALVQRLRESISRTVGEAAANAVHEVTSRLTASRREAAPATHWRDDRERPPWDDPYHDSEWSEGSDYEPRRFRRDDPTPIPSDPSTPSRWHRALATGLQTAAWSLIRQVCRYPVVTSAGLGAGAAMISYAAGPVVGMGVAGIVGATLHLLGLTEAVAASAEALDR